VCKSRLYSELLNDPFVYLSAALPRSNESLQSPRHYPQNIYIVFFFAEIKWLPMCILKSFTKKKLPPLVYPSPSPLFGYYGATVPTEHATLVKLVTVYFPSNQRRGGIP
jgi:hypothetical protein